MRDRAATPLKRSVWVSREIDMFKVFGVRINVSGGVKSTREMFRSTPFQKMVRSIKDAGLEIRMVPSSIPADPSCFLLGVPYSIEKESEMDPVTTLPAGLSEHESELRRFLEDYQIGVIGEMRGVVCAGG